MLTIRKSKDRGFFDHGWLQTYHTFSFADYHDPSHHHFRQLRVINEDTIAGGKGFGTHPHRDMEIITYVTSGALAHKDSMGNGSTIRAGDVQRMSAGTGITHSEFNADPEVPVHLLQIWLLPEKKNTAPSYEQKNFPLEKKRNQLCLICSNDGREGSVRFQQDSSIFATILEKGVDVSHAFANGRGGWIQVVSGVLAVNGMELKAGDGAAIDSEKSITIVGKEVAEALFFDLA